MKRRNFLILIGLITATISMSGCSKDNNEELQSAASNAGENNKLMVPPTVMFPDGPTPTAMPAPTQAPGETATPTPTPDLGLDPVMSPTPTPGSGSIATPTPTPGSGSNATPTPTPTPGSGSNATPTPTPPIGSTATPTPTPGSGSNATPTPTPPNAATGTPTPTPPNETPATPTPTPAGGSINTPTPTPPGAATGTPSPTPIADDDRTHDRDCDDDGDESSPGACALPPVGVNEIQPTISILNLAERFQIGLDLRHGHHVFREDFLNDGGAKIAALFRQALDVRDSNGNVINLLDSTRMYCSIMKDRNCSDILPGNCKRAMKKAEKILLLASQLDVLINKKQGQHISAMIAKHLVWAALQYRKALLFNTKDCHEKYESEWHKHKEKLKAAGIEIDDDLGRE